MLLQITLKFRHVAMIGIKVQKWLLFSCFYFLQKYINDHFHYHRSFTAGEGKKVKHHQSIYQGDKSTNWLNEDDLGTNNALLLLPASEIEEAGFEVAEDVP